VAATVIWVQTDVEKITGRTFIPGISIEDIDGGRFSTDYQSAIDNFIARHLSGFAVSAGTALFQIYDRETPIGYQVSNGYLSPKPGTQRRRERPL